VAGRVTNEKKPSCLPLRPLRLERVRERAVKVSFLGLRMARVRIKYNLKKAL